MKVKEFQNKIAKFVFAWDKKRGAKTNAQLSFNHLIEEIGELAREYVNQESRKEKYSKTQLENAIGDSLMQLAHIHKIDIEKIVLKIIQDEQKILRQN